MYRLYAAALLVTFAGCGAAPVPVDAEAGARVFGGSAPDAWYHDATVAFHEYWSGHVLDEPFCSGTLIGPDIVVTAAHCLEGLGGATIAASSIRVYVGDDPAADLSAHTYAVAEVLKHADYDGTRLLNDIGIVRLTTDAAAAEGITPVPNLPASLGFTRGDVGATMNVAGFGYTESWDYGTKLQADVTVAGFGCAPTGCAGPEDYATQISYDQRTGTGVCTGDSGGSLFVERGGDVYVGGATSYTDYWCAQYGVSTRLDAFESWIADFVGDGTAEPTCGDGTCDAGESCDGRGTTTECRADCPSRTFGPVTTRYCYVGPVCIGAGCP